MEEKEEKKEESIAIKNQNILIERILFIVSLVVVICVMFICMSKKEGMHCDEAFSYGSSNSNYSNTFYSYWKTDPEKLFFDEYVKDSNIFKTIGNFKNYYIDNTEEKDRIVKEKEDEQKEKWRTREEAIDYMQITGNGDAFNFSSVYWNQMSDSNPPLFYMLVNVVSSIFRNSSSYYLIFGINLLFFILTAYVIRKLVIEIKKKEIAIPTLLLYGLSIAGISTVIFLRMYMMLAFFTILYLYLNIRIINRDYHISKKIAVGLVGNLVLGFLTHYYFAIYAFLVSVVMMVILIMKKKYKELLKYVLILIGALILGVLIFPISIYHIFFGENRLTLIADGNYLSRIKQFSEILLNNFGANNIIGIALIILAIFIVVIIKRKESLPIFCIMAIPVVIYTMVIARIAPYIELRYLMNILPIITIFICMMVGSLFDNKSYEMLLVAVMVLGLTGYGFITQKPICLYKGYNNYIKVAEQNRDLDMVYIGYSYFNHIQYMPEFMIYQNSLMITDDNLDWLENSDHLKDKNEFILSIEVTSTNEQKTLKKVLKNTGFEKYEVLQEPIDGIGNKVYKISR